MRQRTASYRAIDLRANEPPHTAAGVTADDRGHLPERSRPPGRDLAILGPAARMFLDHGIRQRLASSPETRKQMVTHSGSS